MSAEFYVYFEDQDFYNQNKNDVISKIKKFKEYSHTHQNKICLNNDIVRFFFEKKYIFLEISYLNKVTHHDLVSFFSFIRMNTFIRVVDEDNVLSNW